MSLDDWLNPPVGDLWWERWCEDAIDEAEGERCENCAGPTFADIDEGKLWVTCIADQDTDDPT